jgi:hypothetical protein
VARTHLRTDSPLKHVRGLRAAAPIDCPVWCLAKRTALCTRSSDRRGAHDPRRRAKPSSERPSAASRSGERARGSPGWRECLIEPGTHRPTRRAADHLTPKRSHGGLGERRRHDNRQPTRWSHPRTARSSALRGAGSAEPGELRSSGQVGQEDVVLAGDAVDGDSVRGSMPGAGDSRARRHSTMGAPARGKPTRRSSRTASCCLMRAPTAASRALARSRAATDGLRSTATMNRTGY